MRIERSDRTSWRLAGAASATVVFVVRLAVSWGRTEYAIWPDEPAQLAMARLVGGGQPWTMHDHSTWRPAYAVLVSPIHWFTSDPAAVMRFALGVNAVLGALAACLLVLLARRLTSLGAVGCAAAATIVALSPARLFTTEFVWSESLTALMFLATLAALLQFWSTPSRRSAVVVGLAAAGAFGAHSRMLPLIVIVIVAIAITVRRRTLPLGDGAIAVTATIASAIAIGAGTRLVVAELWREPSSTNSIVSVAERLVDPGPLLVALAGQSWYQLVSSLGIVAVGGWVVARNSFSAGASAPTRDDARIVGLTVIACAGLSVVFMAGRIRPDQIVYGRYSDIVVSPVLLVGLATIVTVARSTAVRSRLVAAAGIVGLTLATAGVTVVFRGDALSVSNGLEPMILGLQPFRGTSDELEVATMTVVAVAAGSALLATTFVRSRTDHASHRSPVIVLAVLALAVLVGGIRTARILDREWPDRGGHGEVATLADGPLSAGTEVDYFVPAGSDATDRLMLYQMYLPGSRFSVVEDSSEIESSPLVFAPALDDDLSENGARRLWTDRFGRMSLWDRSGARS